MECTESGWSFNRSDPWTFVAVNKEKRKGQYENLVSLQHVEFRLWYESFEDSDPPTHEQSGTQSSDALGPSSNCFSMDSHWQPKQKNTNPRSSRGGLFDFTSYMFLFYQGAVRGLFPEAEDGKGPGFGSKPYLPIAVVALSGNIYLIQKEIMGNLEFSSISQL
jgi:hypothetical protein